jgi:hypothetical protein
MTTNHTRRRVLRTGAAGLAATVGLRTLDTAAGRGNGKDDKLTPGQPFGAVYANGVLWRTNVVRKLDKRPDPEDRIYFLHDGMGPIVDNGNATDQQASPFVSESAPGDRDWNGGKWTHFSAKVTDIDAFNEDAPLDDADEFVETTPQGPEPTKDYIEISLGRPGFGPPDYFICPLNGRA